MLGLDQWLAGFSDGTTLALVAAVAVVLGLRHATDPDHLAAVSILVAAGRGRTRLASAGLGAAWGLGHAVTLFAFGLPIVLFEAFLPERVQRGAETAIGVVIAALAVWLLVRWRRGLLHVHVHDHDGGLHAHVHAHGPRPSHAHRDPPPARSPLQAFGIGLLHGMGGSAGVGVLLLATIDDRAYAVLALAVLALFTAVSMTALSLGLGLGLTAAPLRRSFHRLAPVLGVASLGFGLWYSLGALELAPYYL